MLKTFLTRSCQALLFSGLLACTHTAPKEQAHPMSEQTPANPAFEAYSARFLEALWELEPDWALQVGYFKHLDKVKIPDAAYRKRVIQFTEEQLQALKQLDKATLSRSQQVDAQLIENFLEASRWSLEKEQSYAWNPAQYNISPSIARLFEPNALSQEQRLRTALLYFKQARPYYAAAKAAIKDPTLEHTRLALTQHQGLSAEWQRTYLSNAKKSALSKQEKAAFQRELNNAVAAVDDYRSFLKTLEKRLVKGPARSFRLAPELYRQKFAYELGASLSADEVYAKALEARERTLARMDELAQKLYPTYLPGQALASEPKQRIRAVLNVLAQQHPDASRFRETIAAQIPELERFVREKDLVYLDPSKPLKVRDTPIYARGVAGASVDAPGPYAKGGETFYNVTPIAGESRETIASYLREYNNFTLQILNIHEAIPGHYTQLVHSNESPSLIKSILGNSTMIEGWAVYSERMMLEEGYGAQSPELWLMYDKWHMRVILNTILDYEVHIKGLSAEAGLTMLTNDGFQERAEAEEKWKRATLTQVQLASYFTGYSELYALRNELKSLEAKEFSLRRFHDRFLSYGSAPVKYIRELMLAEPSH